MRLNSTWRRWLCSQRWLHKLTPQLWKCKNVQMLVWTERQKAFLWGTSLGTMTALTIIIIVGTITAQQPPVGKPAAPPKQFHDREPKTPGKLPIAYSTDEPTITFTDCRENAKHHWSCRIKSGGDTEHYVYLPGIKLQNVTPGIDAETSDKGGN